MLTHKNSYSIWSECWRQHWFDQFWRFNIFHLHLLHIHHHDLSIYLHFFKNSRWLTFVFFGCASSWDSYASNGIIYLVSILSVSGARAAYMHISSQTSSHLHAVWRCPEKISSKLIITNAKFHHQQGFMKIVSCLLMSPCLTALARWNFWESYQRTF